MALSHLLLRRFKYSKSISFHLLSQIPNTAAFSSLSNAADSTNQSPSTPKPTSLSDRMSFIFEQIDEIDKKREEKDETLQRIRAWRESKKQQTSPSSVAVPKPPECVTEEDLKAELVKSGDFLANSDVKKEVELVHPWAEWIELMERLVQQNYFDHRRKDEDGMMEGLGIDLTEGSKMEDKGPDFAQDFKTVQAAVVNFGRDRFDILRSLSRQDIQILVGYGCASTDKRVVFASKVLRKHVHLDEGDVCSSCSLRGSCEKAYLLTNKEDEARTLDIMRVLLTYGFDPIDGSVANKSLLKMKPVKTVVRKLLHEVVKLSAVPIDPNLPPPVYKKPPPKVKQPPPPPRKRVGRDDVEMKKGDWLCPKCDFMNFAKNTVCLQCDAKRPKRQLLPGEWECPECNFLNYRRNTACFHCEHKRPPDTYENHFPEKERSPRTRMDKIPDRSAVSNAWNFDFDDNESDGADVAAFEYADSQKLEKDFPLYGQRHEDGPERSSRPSKGFERDYSDSGPMRPSTAGFNDFDDEEDDDLDNYEVVSPNESPNTSRVDFSELESDSESEDVESTEGNWDARGRNKHTTRSQKQMHRKSDDVDFDTDDDLPVHPNWKSSHVADQKPQNRNRGARAFDSDDDDIGFNSGSDDDDERMRSIKKGNGRVSRGTDRITERRRPSFRKESFSEADSDDERIRSKKKGNGRFSKGTDRVTERRRPSFRDESFSEADSDGDNRRGQGRFSRGGKTFRGRGSERMDERRGPTTRGFDRSSGPKRNDRGTFRENSRMDERRSSTTRGFDRSSGPKRNDRGASREGSSYSGGRSKGGRDSNFRSNRQGGSSGKRGGRSSKFDDRSESYLDDERDRRPRNNVR